MSSEHTNRSLTIRTTIPTVKRDQEDTSKNLSCYHTLMTSTPASATGKYCTNYDAEVKALERGDHAVKDLTDTNSEDIVCLSDYQSVSDSLAGHGEHNLRRKLCIILEHRRVILLWIPVHCGIKGNDHADILAKQGVNMEQENTKLRSAL